MTTDARDPRTTAESGLLDGRYALGELLGSGGMADVYAAHDQLLDREVAIKFFRTANGQAERTRFVSEARLLAGLVHPALVTVYDARLDGDQPPYLVLRLVDGGTLRQRISDHGPLTPDRVARIGARLATALAHVHEQGIVHRGVKPSNVLIDSTEACYLANFGLAWTGAVVDQKADVYALGLVLLECLTGRTVSRQPVVPEEIGTSWRHVIASMTADHPADRSDAAEAARHLGLLTQRVSHEQPTSRSSARPRRTTKVRTALGVVGVAALALVVAMTGTAGTAGKPTPDSAPRGLTATPVQLAELPQPTLADTALRVVPRTATPTLGTAARTPSTASGSPAGGKAKSKAKFKAARPAKAGKSAAKPHKGRAADAKDRRGRNK